MRDYIMRQRFECPANRYVFRSRLLFGVNTQQLDPADDQAVNSEKSNLPRIKTIPRNFFSFNSTALVSMVKKQAQTYEMNVITHSGVYCSDAASQS